MNHFVGKFPHHHPPLPPLQKKTLTNLTDSLQAKHSIKSERCVSQMQLTAGDSAPLSAKIGISVEDAAALPSLDVAAERKIERLAMKVGENLFNFMQSFCGVDGSKLVVPMDILDRWFNKFQERAKRDPGFLKSFAL
ncbi:hypothetical protein F2Q68_00008393 [Brassica cretica]|uniref:Hikeshi-like C-terminal domain-containing protein n=1 Tax=Brassica cretica TaxID=69181 RepID=A0A8S9KPN6_BRACR|nr:hypothetical protein F2Q68_00008393 [Brassica cretica]